MTKLIAVVVALATFALICLSIHSMPPVGVVSGVCVDGKTGRPVPFADVEIDLTSPDESSSYQYTSQDDSGDDSTGDAAFSELPAGWVEGSQSDADLDMTGHDNSPKTEWSVGTDANGRFRIQNVTAGSYTVSASASGYDSGSADLAVAEQINEPVTITMDRSAPSLTFDTPGKYWSTGQVPSLGLNGTLENPSIRLGLTRLDLDKAVKLCPALFLQNENSLDDLDVPRTQVNHWSMQIADADSGGVFYDQIQCRSADGGSLPAGLYQLTASASAFPNVSSSVLFSVTDIAVIGKEYDTTLMVQTVGLLDGKARSGLTCRCVDDDKTGSTLLSQGTSDSHGLCLLSISGAPNESRGIALARQGNSVAAMEMNLNSPGTEDENSGEPTSVTPGARELRGFIYTDRTVYRPGATVRIKGISRWFQPSPGFIVPTGVKFDVQITDAQDTIVNRQTVTTDRFGSWSTSFTLSDEALTGGYTVTETYGDLTATGTFAVAAYRKPEYSVAVTFDKQRYVRGDTITATVTATYYFGAPLSGASGSFSYYRRSSEPGDDGDDPDDSGDFIDSENFTLDGNGRATVAIDTSDQDPAEMEMTYTVNANVDDKSGQPVTAESAVVVAQGDFSIAATPSSTVASVGDTIEVTAAATGETDLPLPGKTLAAEASYDVWRNGQDIYTPIASATIVTGSDGTAQFVVRASKAGLIDVKFSGVDSRGNHVTNDTQVWVPDKDSDIDAQYANLSVVLGKPKYQPGDTAQVLITTAHPGPDCLVTVEGTTLYKAFVVHLTRRATEVDIPVTEAYAPGVTIEAECIVDRQCLSSSESLAMDDPVHALSISLQTDKARYHPGDVANIAIHTADSFGHPVSAEVSVAVVDAAIFDVMPESSNTISDTFLPEQDDNVVDSDSTQVIYYGDVDKGAADIDIRRNFPDTALWEPNVLTNSCGDACVSLRLPDNLTTWRITTYGQTVSSMFGKGVANMVVNKDLSVSLETPPFLVQGDRSTLIAMVHNDTGAPLTTHLELDPGGLSVEGSLAQDIVAPANSTSRFSWPVASRMTGNYSPEVTVRSGILNDGAASPLQVYPHGAQYVTYEAGSLIDDVTEAVHLDGSSLRPNTELTVRLTPTLASALPAAAEYLSTYPYGSSDSTISALAADATLYSVRNSLQLSPEAAVDIKAKANRSLLRSYRLQNDDGGWGWFSINASSCWMTANATYGLTLARSSGLTVNPAIMQAALKATVDLSGQERSKESQFVDTSAIALSALVLAQNGWVADAEKNIRYLELSQITDRWEQSNSDIATAALAEQIVGTPASKEEARRLMGGLWSVGRETGAMLSWTEEYHSSAAYAGEYEPDADATAWALLAAEAITPADPRIDEAARWLVASRNDDHWSNIDTTEVAILAVSKYISTTNELAPNFSSQVLVNGKTIGSLKFDKGSVGSPDIVLKVFGDDLETGDDIIEISKTGSGRLYYSIKLSQMIPVPVPQPPPSLFASAFERLLNPPDQLPPTVSGYRIKRIYMRLTSRRNFLWEDTVPKPDWIFENGDSILVRLIIDSVRPGSRIVVDEPVPPGCRIGEVSGDEEDNWSNWWDYTDVRDTDIVFFVSDMTTGRHEIDYHLIASRAGEYDVMPTNVSSMVDPTLNVEGIASKVRIDGN